MSTSGKVKNKKNSGKKNKNLSIDIMKHISDLAHKSDKIPSIKKIKKMLEKYNIDTVNMSEKTKQFIEQIQNLKKMKAKKKLEAKAKKEWEAKTKKKLEEKAKKEREAKAKKEREAKAKKEREANAKKELEAKKTRSPKRKKSPKRKRSPKKKPVPPKIIVTKENSSIKSTVNKKPKRPVSPPMEIVYANRTDKSNKSNMSNMSNKPISPRSKKYSSTFEQDCSTNGIIKTKLNQLMKSKSIQVLNKPMPSKSEILMTMVPRKIQGGRTILSNNVYGIGQSTKKHRPIPKYDLSKPQLGNNGNNSKNNQNNQNNQNIQNVKKIKVRQPFNSSYDDSYNRHLNGRNGMNERTNQINYYNSEVRKQKNTNVNHMSIVPRQPEKQYFTPEQFSNFKPLMTSQEYSIQQKIRNIKSKYPTNSISRSNRGRKVSPNRGRFNQKHKSKSQNNNTDNSNNYNNYNNGVITRKSNKKPYNHYKNSQSNNNDYYMNRLLKQEENIERMRQIELEKLKKRQRESTRLRRKQNKFSKIHIEKMKELERKKQEVLDIRNKNRMIEENNYRQSKLFKSRIQNRPNLNSGKLNHKIKLSQKKSFIRKGNKIIRIDNKQNKKKDKKKDKNTEKVIEITNKRDMLRYITTDKSKDTKKTKNSKDQNLDQNHKDPKPQNTIVNTEKVVINQIRNQNENKNKTNIPKKLTKKKVRFQVATTQKSDTIVGIPKVFQEKVKNFNHNEMLNQKNSFVHNFNIEIVIPIPIIEENYSILKIKNILLQNKIIKSGINTPHKILRYLYQYCIMDNLCILHYPCRKDI